MSGTHVYDIRYRSTALSAQGDGSEFYWNLIPSGWRMPIQRLHG